MNKAEYIRYLESKGYEKRNYNQMIFCDLIFDIKQNSDKWCLKLNKESNLNLIPPAWTSLCRA